MSNDGEDEEAFRAFCTARIPALVGFGYGLTGDGEAARDLVQAALARTFAAWPRVERKDDPEAYVRRAMVNLAANRRRRREWREQPTAEVPEGSTVDDPPGAVADRDALVRALAGLPPRQRAVVVLRFSEDRSEADTAALMGCSVGTVKSQTSKGLAKLRAALGPLEVLR